MPCCWAFCALSVVRRPAGTGAVIEPREGEPYGEFTRDWGEGPIQADRVHGSFDLGKTWTWRTYDFLLGEVGKGKGASIQLEGEELFLSEMRR